MQFSDTQLLSWLQMALWPMVRIGGVMMAAPILGTGVAPQRVRLLLVLTLTALIAPLLPPAPLVPAWTAAWWLRTAQELSFGLALGFVLKIVFEAVILGGELIGNGMGIGFARLADPLRGADAPVVGQFLQIMAILLFLAVGGHLTLIRALADSFHTMPVGGAMLGPGVLMALARFGGELFAGAVSIALPTVGALLLVNLAFGIMSRSAPTFNALSVGFPLSIVCGLVLMRVDLPQLSSVFSSLLDDAFAVIAALIGQR
jgi:flagellar biosynthetic protein FliR